MSQHTPRVRLRGRIATIVTWRVVAVVLLALPGAGAAWAQYTADGPEDLQQGSGVRYFGSARDERGARLADVTFLFEAGQSSFVFVTDSGGRFRGLLPLASNGKRVDAKCWKVGLETVRIERRTGPDRARPSVQVDCVLRRPAKTARNASSAPGAPRE